MAYAKFGGGGYEKCRYFCVLNKPVTIFLHSIIVKVYPIYLIKVFEIRDYQRLSSLDTVEKIRSSDHLICM